MDQIQLDFLGDLSLLGAPVRAEFFIEKSGHTFNVTAVRELSARKTGKKGGVPSA